MSLILHDTPPIPVQPLAPTYPPWCALPAGHALDCVDVDGSTYLRHRAVVLADDPDGHRLDLTATTYVRPHGHLEHEPPAVMVDRQPDVLLSAAQARRQTAALLLAADLLDGTEAGR